ncbi:MAG: HlyD family efflux transporter periplasmic adaptor subunit [Planctomycetaceae bacterium]|nr:HlyD family efflux transporter periplasmic adaptor subunit [Planctomycetaceae bacterium]
MSKLILPVAALAMLGFGVFHLLKAQQTLPKPPPPVEPARNPFSHGIAAAGIVESRSENIAIGSALAGLVLEVYVPVEKVGIQVSAGEPLFRVDDRQLRARLAMQQAELAAAQAQLARLEAQPRTEEIPPAEARVKAAYANALRLQDQSERARKLLANNSIAVEESNDKQRLYEQAVEEWHRAKADLKLLQAGAWEPDKAIARAAVAQAQAQIGETQTEIDRTLVRAPVAGRVLQVNVRPGEYVSAAAGQALVVLGDSGSLHVRADIDEHDIPRFARETAARAFLRGPERKEVDLRFVRVEPYVVPKRSLTGDNTERVDTRVLQVIFEVASQDQPLFVGQQVDVFIDEQPASASKIEQTARAY